MIANRVRPKYWFLFACVAPSGAGGMVGRSSWHTVCNSFHVCMESCDLSARRIDEKPRRASVEVPPFDVRTEHLLDWKNLNGNLGVGGPVGPSDNPSEMTNS